VEAEDGRVVAMCCIGLFYPNFVVFFVLGHKDSLVISFFSINMTLRAGGEVCNSAIPLPLPSDSSFLRGLSMLHGVSKKMRESERFVQSSKEWMDVVAVSHLIDV
jgi:hypothetical protein